MTLKIISAQEILFDGEVSSVSLPGSMGEFTVLHNHATLLATLEAGKVTYTDASGSTGEARISGGIADIDNNIVSVCVY
ncbi:MAG: F0F1 ATP synthase subunit epsilon [Muribaculaceae bacterium]|jgi:F-type H+-transporting ATPase subunit epsilon|nr:F0F1 ATP synthase subunit epsilon [Muribaculaceae bacterium]